MQLPLQLWVIFYSVVFPMLLIVLAGYIVQRWLGMDMTTLVRLNFYFLVPTVVFYVVIKADVRLDQVAKVFTFHFTLMAILAALTMLAARIRGIPRDRRNAMIMSAIFYNSGNYGLPLQAEAFRAADLSDKAVGLQAFVLLTQNFTSFTLGVLLAAAGGHNAERQLRKNLMSILKFPPLYALAGALIVVQIRGLVGADSAGALARQFHPFWIAISNVYMAFIAIALFTLGTQLARVQYRGEDHYPVKMMVFIKLLVAPAIGLGLIYLFDLTGFEAQVLLISAGTPTAVNCMLLCLQFENHPDFVARNVFWSTILSPVTVTGVIFFAQNGFVQRLAIQP